MSDRKLSRSPRDRSRCAPREARDVIFTSTRFWNESRRQVVCDLAIVAVIVFFAMVAFQFLAAIRRMTI
jgi:hypothetical protein